MAAYKWVVAIFPGVENVASAVPFPTGRVVCIFSVYFPGSHIAGVAVVATCKGVVVAILLGILLSCFC